MKLCNLKITFWIQFDKLRKFSHVSSFWSNFSLLFRILITVLRLLFGACNSVWSQDPFSCNILDILTLSEAQRHLLCYSIPILILGVWILKWCYLHTYVHTVWPELFFCKHLNLVVNKQDWRTMKTTIKIFLSFPLF